MVTPVSLHSVPSRGHSTHWPIIVGSERGVCVSKYFPSLQMHESEEVAGWLDWIAPKFTLLHFVHGSVP